ncbi:MAG: MBL fold metallo-hydrolase [Lentimicrobiaceae bacterium]|jgi:phosphoribosyl 1,2-cyclic phosphodiesterase|nr:MBL fold metallo-hydrolase [Lentimicrobiaceae bacterium]MDD4599124.1 MBL fold metallo-hydrolase [Lentimicrobiaceae bacterium]MDY0026995.1 MBL fold metallo-hydrolase [Lentimicrobium sp.]
MSPTLFPVQFQLCSLSSGSSGNCYFVGSSSEGILVDAGISARRIRKTLEEIGVGLDLIKGIFITHDHIDHISALTLLSKKHQIPIYCTEGTWKGILRNRTTFDLDQRMFRPIVSGLSLEIAGMKVESFPVSHDARDAVGYHISNSSRKLTLATDLGHIGKEAAHFLRMADILVIESNYDEHMLLNGRYPKYLKDRVHGQTGHMCNSHTAEFVAGIYHNRISHILLCHLSAENNHPETALQTLTEALRLKGLDFEPYTLIEALPRGRRSPLYVFE